MTESGKLLKHMVNALTSLSMCIFGSHSSNTCLTSHETLIPNNCSVWMRKGSYVWAFAFFVLDLILLIFVRPFHALNVISSCILYILHLFVCIVLFLILLLYFSFVWVKNLKLHKKWKIQKVWLYMFKHISYVSLALYLCTNDFVHLRA